MALMIMYKVIAYSKQQIVIALAAENHPVIVQCRGTRTLHAACSICTCTCTVDARLTACKTILASGFLSSGFNTVTIEGK